ncbi:MAG: NAD(P)H-quinone oxidoreductase [Pseudomonadota bacterium]
MALPEMMQAIIAKEPGGPKVLTAVERKVPVPAPSEVLIKVEGAGVNRLDCLQREGNYPPPPGAGDVLGLEVAGTVVAVGDEVRRYAVGDPVLALVSGGGYAEFCAAAESNTLPTPPQISATEAAGIPETFFTVWSNMFDRAGLTAGEWLLVHGGSSGIGTTAIQLAKAFGAHVIATVGSPEKMDACKTLGADLVVNYKTDDFVAAVKDATPAGANVIIDMVGGEYVERNWRAAAEEARIVQIAMLGGVSTANFWILMRKRLVHTGSTLRTRSVEFKAAIAKNLEEKVWPLMAAGTVRPVMDRTFSFADAAAAHARMEGGEHIGKIVLTP